jgi:GGDEF domain-containing protein
VDPAEDSAEPGFVLTGADMVWRWASGWLVRQARPRLLSRPQFERRAKHQLSGGWGRSGALLFVGVDRLPDAERILGRHDCEHFIRRFSELVVAIASECPATLVSRDAILVYAHSTTHSIDMAEAIRVAVQQELGLERRKVLDQYDQVRWPVMTHQHVLTVTVGACAFAPQQDFEEALQRAEDALLQAKQAGGNRYVLSSAHGAG